jgi:hypothetical protein
MTREPQQSNSGDSNAELAFVQQALEAADRSERSSRIIVGVLVILAVVVFFWMHLNLSHHKPLADSCILGFASISFSSSSCSPSPCTFDGS